MEGKGGVVKERRMVDFVQHYFQKSRKIPLQFFLCLFFFMFIYIYLCCNEKKNEKKGIVPHIQAVATSQCLRLCLASFRIFLLSKPLKPALLSYSNTKNN